MVVGISVTDHQHKPFPLDGSKCPPLTSGFVFNGVMRPQINTNPEKTQLGQTLKRPRCSLPRWLISASAFDG